MSEEEDLVARIPTPESLEKLAKNVAARKPALAAAARRRAVKLRAERFGATTEAERDAIEALEAYEQTLLEKHGRRVLASRTRRMIEARGIIQAVENLVLRSDETMGYQAVVAMGMPDMTFEAVILRHPSAFSAAAVTRAKERLRELAGA